MASVVPEDRESFLWTLIESRDRAFARAHESFLALTREAEEKDREIQRLTAWARELEIAPRELDRLLAEALGSMEYKLGSLLLHPVQVLTARLRKKRT
jgi:hypothetical protein